MTDVHMRRAIELSRESVDREAVHLEPSSSWTVACSVKEKTGSCRTATRPRMPKSTRSETRAGQGSHSLQGAVIYTSCEPCPMCLAAIWWARISRIVFANSRDAAADIGFDDAALYSEVSAPLENRKIKMSKATMLARRKYSRHGRERCGRRVSILIVGWAKRKRAHHSTMRSDRWWARRKSAFAHPTLTSCYHPSSTILPRDLPDSSSACARFRLAALMVPKV